MSRIVKSAEGTGTVEFALVGVLVFTLFLGVIEGARVFSSWLVITNESREAARWGAVRVGDPSYADLAALETAVEDKVAERTGGVLSHDPMVFQVDCTATETAVSVNIDYTVEAISPLISSMWPSFQLASQSTMRSE
ncbi:MAG: TadE/TadG family type IV pilus assembly protein [Chloroflexota bacterium]